MREIKNPCIGCRRQWSAGRGCDCTTLCEELMEYLREVKSNQEGILKVYIVERHDWEYSIIHGIYDTLEKAQNEVIFGKENEINSLMESGDTREEAEYESHNYTVSAYEVK